VVSAYPARKHRDEAPASWLVEPAPAMDHRLLGARMEAARLSLRSRHSPHPRARGTPVITRFWCPPGRLRFRLELAHTAIATLVPHRHDADALDHHLRMVDL
jgi:hypothetical protein